MAELKGVNVHKLQGGLGRTNGNVDNHVAYIVSMLDNEIAAAINNFGKGVMLTSAYDAEVLGINASYDANNSVNIYNQIVEFFRLAPEAKLYLFNSVVEADLKGFINQNKEIKGYGTNITFNSEIPNLLVAINFHQAIVNAFAAENRLIDFVFIGADKLDVFTVNLFEQTAPSVSVFIGCEKPDEKVCIGSALGMIAVRNVNENIGSVDIQDKPRAKRGTIDYSLTDATQNRWLTAYLSDGREVSALLNSELFALKSKGYVTIAGYEGYPGQFIENSYTCVERASDFAFIENNRVWNKAARLIRTTLLPKVKGVVKKNPSTGFIATTTVSYWEQLINKALDTMVSEDEISGYEVSINPEQIVSSTEPVVVKASVVSDGIVHEFDVAIGLTNQI